MILCLSSIHLRPLITQYYRAARHKKREELVRKFMKSKQAKHSLFINTLSAPFYFTRLWLPHLQTQLFYGKFLHESIDSCGRRRR